MKIYDHGLEWLVLCKHGDHEYVAAAFFIEMAANDFAERFRSVASEYIRVVNKKEVEIIHD